MEKYVFTHDVDFDSFFFVYIFFCPPFSPFLLSVSTLDNTLRPVDDGVLLCRVACVCFVRFLLLGPLRRGCAYYPGYRGDHAVENGTFEQVFRERLKVLHSKINARNERIKLLIQRGSPDLEPLDPA